MEQGIMYQYTPQKRKPNLLSIRPRLLRRLPLARLLQVRFLHIDLSFYLRFRLILRFWFVTLRFRFFPQFRFFLGFRSLLSRFCFFSYLIDSQNRFLYGITDFNPRFQSTICYHSPRFVSQISVHNLVKLCYHSAWFVSLITVHDFVKLRIIEYDCLVANSV